MKLFNMYIFDRSGVCIFYREWNRERQAGSLSRQEECKLMLGMLVSLQSFAAKLSPSDSPQTLQYFETSAYRLNYLATPTGLKFVLNSQPDAPNALDLLHNIYAQIYVPYVVKSPQYKPGAEITSSLFISALDALVEKNS